MGVRLNKVLSELNIGFETAVEFLKKKTNLGEIKDDATPNTKISDGQYEALVNEFNTDKAVKTKAEQLFTKKVKEKKVEKPEQKEKAVAPTDELLEHRPQFKAVGKIDLDSIGKPKAKPEPEQKPQPEPEQKPQPKPEQKPQPEPEPAPVETAEPQAPEPEVAKTEPQVAAAEPAPTKDVEPQQKETPAEKPAAQEEQQTTQLAKTPGDLKAAQNAPQLNVLGKIDLDSINQSTRPKKKSKEERRKEREEKAAGERKKRERIRQGKVDIEAAAKQASKNEKKNKPNNQQQQNQQQQGGGKKNKKNRPVQKPLEVDDEACGTSGQGDAGTSDLKDQPEQERCQVS